MTVGKLQNVLKPTC